MGLKDDEALIKIGFDKNGEAEFGIRMSIADLSYERMQKLRAMIPVAIAQAERIWHDHGPPSKEMAQCAATNIIAIP